MFQRQRTKLLFLTAKATALSCCFLLLYQTTLSQTPMWHLAPTSVGRVFAAIDVYDKDPDTVYAISATCIVKSTDRGLTWDSISSKIRAKDGGAALQVDPYNSQILYSTSIGISTESVDPYMSTDGGATWRLLFIGFAFVTPIIQIDPMDHNIVYVGVGPSRLYRTTDQGTSWDTIPPIGGQFLFSLAIAPTNDSILYVGCNNGIYKSTDKAHTWSLLPFNYAYQSIPRLAIDPHNSDILYAAIWLTDTTLANGLFKTTDGGTTWTENNNGISIGERQIAAISVNPKNSNDLFIGVSNDSGPILLRSTDGATHWFPFRQGLSSWGDISCFAFDTMHSKMYAGGGWYPDSEGIYVLDTLFDTVVPTDKNLPNLISLGQNYPNPFNSETIIRFNLVSSEFVSLKVYDELGREIAVLIDGIKTKGSHSVNWNGMQSASGVYFYRLTTPHFNEAKKMILLR
jgi:photosystem II stability/assembly factor-like uncharacterized protein